MDTELLDKEVAVLRNFYGERGQVKRSESYVKVE
jgi:hypothetical protein